MAEKKKKEVGRLVKKAAQERMRTGPQEERVYKGKINESLAPGALVSLDIDDEITTLYDKVKKLRHDTVYVIVPARASLFQSVVNLKILKRKVDSLDKQLIIITGDKNGAKLCEKVGFQVEEGTSVRPILGEQKDTGRVRPIRIARRKLAIADLLDKGKKTALFGMFEKLRATVRQKKKKSQDAPRIVIAAPNKQALFTLIVVSVLVLLVITYIALPGATIYLTPAANPIEQPVNITLLDFDKNQLELESHKLQTIASYAVTPPPFEKTITVNATGKEFLGKNASGKIVVVNERTTAWPLVASTRFQTENGIVFRIERAVTVPARAARSAENGRIEIEVAADPYDAFGQVVGARGNIGPTRFFLPGLKSDENRALLYAVSETPMIGGETQTKKIVTEQDVAAGLERVKKELLAEASDRLKVYVAEQNAINKTNLTLLDDARAMIIGEPTSEIATSVVGQELQSFEVSGRLSVRGTAFNRNELINILRNELTTKKSPEKSIARIDDENISYKIFDVDDREGLIRLTATIRGIERFEIDPEKENGERLGKKIKEHILGVSIQSATNYIQNLPEIDSVEIKSWPLWAPSIPSVADNIEIVIVEDQGREEPEN